MSYHHAFITDETGAITIDWVALTGLLVVLGIAVVAVIYGFGVSSAVEEITTTASGVSLDPPGTDETTPGVTDN